MTTKHIHILGICGTFMGGIAMILEPSQLQPAPDMIIVGNAMKRGNPSIEYMLENNIPYTSGPQWLHDHLLRDRWVLAVSGTHGKTTTTGMLTWILERNDLEPGFLIGGIAGNFGISARLGKSPYFVIEADEYDTAFFDKRSKFVHYNPRTLIINNIGFDHADIFEDLKAIQRQFHHMIRTIPNNGRILSFAGEQNVEQSLAMGCWSECQYVGKDQEWYAERITHDCTAFAVFHKGEKVAEVHWNIVGEHNMRNGLIAVAAAYHAGVSIQKACEALGSFINAKRRLEVKGNIHDITVYDDFAHHPTEIRATLTALRDKVGANTRILAVLEPRSNTMKMGVHKDEIAPALENADAVFLFQPETIPWKVTDIADTLTQPAAHSDDLAALVNMIATEAKPTDHILVMSNGSFGGIHQKILDALQKKNI